MADQPTDPRADFVCAHCGQEIYDDGSRWRHLDDLLSACSNGRTNAQPGREGRQVVADEPGCPACRTILNARSARCDNPWHADNQPAAPDQPDQRRAAQIQAVDNVLRMPHNQPPDDGTLAELVDAVHANTGTCGETTGPLPIGAGQAWCTLPAGHGGKWHKADDGTTWVPFSAGRDDHDRFAGRALEDPDVRAAYRRDAEAHGWRQAVDALRDDERYAEWWKSRPEDQDTFWRRTARKDLADYLEAVGPEAARTSGVRVEIGGHDVTDMIAGDPRSILVPQDEPCSCPDIDASTMRDDPRNPPTVKGYDPDCPTHGGHRG